MRNMKLPVYGWVAFSALLLVFIAVVAFWGASTQPARSIPDSQPVPPPNVNHVDPLPPPQPVAKYAGPPPPIVCVPADQPHIHLWLATPPGPGAGVTAAQVRAGILSANGFVNETASPGSAALRMLCDQNGQPTVTPISVTDASFYTAVAAVKATGGDPGDTRHQIIENATSPGYYAGIGEIGQVDSGTYYSAVWQYPIDTLMLHEITHTLSAVQGTPYSTTPPGSSGAGHCRDGLDVECYNDGGPWGAQIYPPPCKLEVWDCNRDTYANACPPVGSWLADHPEFNLLGPKEKFIQVNAACGGGTTTTTTTPTSTTTVPPSGLATPAGLKVTLKTCTSVGVAWDPVLGASSYYVSRRLNAGGWGGTSVTPFPRLNASWSTDGSYDFRVRAVSASGQSDLGYLYAVVRSCGGSTTSTTTTVPPTTTQPPTTTTTVPPAPLSAPANLHVTTQTCTTVSVAWTAVPGASAYVVQRQLGAGVWAYLGKTPLPRWNANWTANGVYTFRVAGADGAGVAQGPYSTVTATRAC